MQTQVYQWCQEGLPFLSLVKARYVPCGLGVAPLAGPGNAQLLERLFPEEFPYKSTVTSAERAAGVCDCQAGHSFEFNQKVTQNHESSPKDGRTSPQSRLERGGWEKK